MQLQRRVESWWTQRSIRAHPRIWVPLDRIPTDLIHFVWASEDQNFFDHHGFDWVQLRKTIAATPPGKKVSGASTITMQCARSVFLWQGRSFLRKGLEAYYTVWMELLMSKRRILELYLNQIEWGPGIYGIGAAAHAHFGKPPSALTREQEAALAAILPNPRQWPPARSHEIVQRKIRRVERLASRAPFPVTELNR